MQNRNRLIENKPVLTKGERKVKETNGLIQDTQEVSSRNGNKRTVLGSSPVLNIAVLQLFNRMINFDRLN